MSFDRDEAGERDSCASPFDSLAAMPRPWGEDGLRMALLSVARHYGFAHGAIFAAHAVQEPASELRVVLSSWSDPFTRGFTDMRIGCYSPLVRALKADPAPFAWDLESLYGYDPAQPEMEPVVRFLLAGEHLAGIYFPIHGPGGLHGAAGFAGRENRLSPGRVAELHCVAFSLFGVLSACRFEANRLTNPLSQRERDCLRLAMLGKTSSEIGALLTLSEYTVSQHLASATRKMGAANRTHAVAMAAQLGYLS